jgi:stress response protein SCP2
MNISKGQRVALATLFENHTQADRFQVGLSISGNKEAIDFACFGLDQQQQLSDDAYMTFFKPLKTNTLFNHPFL